MADDTPPSPTSGQPPRKKLSGRAGRKLREERRQLEEARERTRRVLFDGQPPLERLISALGPPPLDAVGGVAYANKAAQSLLHVVLTDPVMPLPERLRWAKDLIAVIGMTASKAVSDDRIAQLEREVFGKAVDDDDGESDELDGSAETGGTAEGLGGGGEEPVPRPLHRLPTEDE